MREQVIEIKVKDRHQEIHTLVAPTDMDMNLMEVLKSYELPVEGVCGGMALCASCHCYVQNRTDMHTPNDAEQAMLDETEYTKDNSRLACQIRVTEDIDGLAIELAPESQTDEDQDW